MRAKAVGSTAAAAVLAVMLAVPNVALGLTSVEGAVIGDQGYYWTTPAESWIFPHRIANIDNRVMLQYGVSSGTTLYNLESVQREIGGGFVLEIMENLNVGMWITDYNPGMNGFASRAITATNFVQKVTGAVNDLAL